MTSGRTSVGGMSGMKPACERAVEREVHQRDLEARADAGEEVEAAARHLGAALHVDRAEQLAELEVVAGLEVERRASRRGCAA